MTQRQTSVDALRKDKHISMRQNSMENQTNKRRQYQQQSSVINKLVPFVSQRVNVVIGVLMLSILINLGLVLGVVFMIVENKTHHCLNSEQLNTYPNKRESICLPCDFIKDADTMSGAYVEGPHNTGRHPNDFSVHSPTERKDVCCMDARTGLRVLMERMPAEQQRVLALQSTNPDCVPGMEKNVSRTNEKPADSKRATVAHMYLDISSLQGALLKWEVVSTLAGIKSGDLQYGDGMLTIHTDGPFFVYCQITFHYIPRNGQQTTSSAVPLVHNIVAKRGAKTEVLLQNKLKLDPDNFRESYLGAVLGLRKGDKLFVYNSAMYDDADMRKGTISEISRLVGKRPSSTSRKRAHAAKAFLYETLIL
ncbi:hypothetical protein ScPMuIL_018342 [Solemya velum]